LARTFALAASPDCVEVELTVAQYAYHEPPPLIRRICLVVAPAAERDLLVALDNPPITLTLKIRDMSFWALQRDFALLPVLCSSSDGF
jgi:hypothetical protein